MRLARGDTLVVASHNLGKLREIRELLSPFGLEIRGAGEMGLAEPEETGATFIANAELKARASATASGFHALADDSGLAVAGLDGAPGIYSARWAGPEKDFATAMARIETELRDRKTEDLSAKFVCVLSLAAPDGAVQSFEGEVHGHLVFPPRGKNGFGYDPIFVADGMSKTFGEIAPADKHAMSHRAMAFAKFQLAVLKP
jgi:XTP/dITP diphosphohydrolase